MTLSARDAILKSKYYAHIKGAVDIRLCSRCLQGDAEYLHTAWLVKWPTLCARCYLVLVASERTR
jgi:hypothetical protein